MKDNEFCKITSTEWHINEDEGGIFKNQTKYAEQGIIHGYGDETYGGAKPVTREELAVMLYRYAGEPEVDDDQSGILSSQYADSGEIADYSKDALVWATLEGILQGNGKGELKPKSATTRAETAIVVQRFCKNV